MGKNTIGEFEEILMLTVGVLYKEAYGIAIKKLEKLNSELEFFINGFMLTISSKIMG